MAKPVAARVAEHRSRQKAEGLISVSIVVPQTEARFFRELAAASRKKRRRGLHSNAVAPVPAPRSLSMPQLRLAERWLAAAGLKLSPDRPGLTLAQILAHVIIFGLSREGWQLGRRLGTQSELMARYGVGRNLLHQAVHLLEHQGLVHLQRGEDGVLIVTRPSQDFPADASATYLVFRGIPKDDLVRTRRELEQLALDRCLERLDTEGRQRLQAQLEAEQHLDHSAASAAQLQAFHLLLAQLGGDASLEYMISVLLRLYRHRARPRGARHDLRALEQRRIAHAEIARAVLDNQGDRARELLLAELESTARWID